MNSHLKALLGVQLRMAWRGFRKKLGGGKSPWGMLLLPLLGLAMLPLMGAFAGFSFALYVGATLLGQSHLMLTLLFSAAQVTSLTFGVFYVISAFYFAKDLSLLMPLPIRPNQILFSKFLSVMAGQYLTLAPLLLPGMLIYGILADVSWLYIPYALVIFLLIPVPPLVISALFSITLMRLTNLSRNRDIWRVVGALFGLGMVFAFQFVSRFTISDATELGHSVQDFLIAQERLINLATRYFPTSAWAAGALREAAPTYGAVPFLLFTGVALLSIAVLLWVAERYFLGGLIGSHESRASGRVLTAVELASQTALMRQPSRALLLREIRLLNRTPSFLMAGVIPVVLMPVFILLPMLQRGETLSSLFQVASAAGNPLVPVIATGTVLLMNSMSNIAATAISREGRYLWISRALPIAPRVQIEAKAIHAMFFAILPTGLVAAACGWLGLFDLQSLLGFLACTFLATLAMAYGGLLIDTLNPNLTWTDPQRAMRGNWNTLLALLLLLVVATATAAVTALLLLITRWAVLPGLLLFLAVLALGFRQIAGAVADRKYTEYEQ